MLLESEVRFLHCKAVIDFFCLVNAMLSAFVQYRKYITVIYLGYVLFIPFTKIL